MSDGSPSDVTRLLRLAAEGDQDAAAAVFPLIEDALRAAAKSRFRKEPTDHTLQPTVLVHDAFLKMLGQDSKGWKNRGHFVALASQAMRRFLMDHARGRGRDRRGGDWGRVALDDIRIEFRDGVTPLVEVDEALSELSRKDARKAAVVEMHFFGGASFPDIAEYLGVSLSTAEKDWAFSRAWLMNRLAKEVT